MQPKSTIRYEDFAKLDLRVATIVAADVHPNADRLLKLQIDLDGHERQICAGIKPFYEPERLVGRQIIVVANLEPRTIRGELSNGMLLAATVADGPQVQDVVILQPLKQVPSGTAVS